MPKEVVDRGVNKNGDRYTCYSDGGYRYDNADRSSYYSPKGGDGGNFYTAPKGSGSGSYYQNRDGDWNKCGRK
ncbi:hypothetical protein KIPB_015129 [Kipferlia bialata]|uniref:Uncharacterized protein n=1 Tax=Kipferlia bialata TaxID=797122 RepID=A0A391PBL0_9EUKA|nr:hypothetical protein KIPB_015129 [Kipferlia bialata]|eukprot:g15129.t1